MTKLMLVEDDNNLREIYSARLQAEGYTIVSARDGEEALVVAKAEKPDLIISDVMMPKISGFEMLDILRNTDGLKEVKVIMLTALGQSDDQQRADKLGADRYLVKSQVTLEDIVKVAHELLGDSGAAPATAPTPEATPAVAIPSPVTTPADPAPAPEPAVTSVPVVDAPAEPVTPPASNDSGATSTAQEEADVEAKIEDFVAGATESPGAPEAAAPDAAPAPEPVASAPTEPTPPAPETAEAQDNLVSQAADTLQASATPADQPSGAPAPSPAVAAGANPEPKKVGGERVIQPIASEPKKDIDTLLAIEEAKGASSQPAVEPKAVVGGDTPPATPPTPSAGNPVDPNSIAL